MSEWRKIEPSAIGDNIFQAVGEEWMLITAGTEEDHNTMTASWGGMGVLWNKPVVFIFVRPSRHTYSFIENNENFTLTFFEEEHKEILEFCGTNSGREVNKTEKCELTPLSTLNGSVYFAEGRLAIECKKIYAQDIDPELFLDPAIAANYPEGEEYHKMYIGEIVQVLSNP
ncbi:NADH-FMN oxidoreductase RutF [Candidatus Termititenax dinenymphae]|uniref:NADH-FMN oxidoreductase RutF n=1 Tax=Candidatus Termititenax dinenymphae TaxID=2218523 RepID=A0A388TJB7_9BACT|nr:NADH-FMN oxidoreductase RutF [Candidatus Termititenax dinenymphae]